MSDIIIGLVVDRSGSMSGIWDDTVGGVQSLVDEQRDVDGRAFLTMAVFDTHYDLLHDTVELTTLDGPVVPNHVRPRGGTALIDAVYRTIKQIEDTQKFSKFAPRDVVVVITTDGNENASVEHSAADLRKLVDAKTEQGWEFVYLGANQDAWAVGSGLGFGHNSNWVATGDGTRAAYGAVGQSLTSYRGSGLSDDLHVNL